MSNTELEPVTEKLPEVKHMRNSRLDDSLFSKDLAPHYMKLAGQLATSELVPKCYRGKPQDLFLCWSIGYSIGMSPEQSMQCIAIINGKPCMYGDEMLALCMIHKDFEDIIENPIVKNDSIIGYSCTVKRKGRADKESVFTLDMAKKAGLLAKGGVWNQYPERMLKFRARGFCLRDAFPDALKGIKPREEVEDYIIDADYAPVEQKGSRTERLKQDILTKQGVSDVESVNGLCAPSTDSAVEQEVSEDEEPREEIKIGDNTPWMHSEVKRLIASKGFAQDRLSKALEYYEVEIIEQLTWEQAHHFIEQLLKL